MSIQNPAKTLAELASFGTATIGEVAPQARILANGLKAIVPDISAAGFAVTVKCRPGDNLALHLAIAQLAPGDFLVVDYGDSLESGPFGEIMALACQVRGAHGLLTNGAVRDTAQIRAMKFPVFARGTAIKGTTKADRGEIGIPVVLAETTINPGDVVVADDDAVLVMPAAALNDTLDAARTRFRKEEVMMARLRKGETTLEILGLEGR